MAVGCAIGAWSGASIAVAPPTGWWVVGACALVAMALASRRRRSAGPVMVLAALLIGAQLGARAEADYVPVRSGPILAEVLVVGDPAPIGGGWLLELRLPDGDRVQARAYGRSGAVAQRAGVGDRLRVRGTVGPVDDRPWLKVRHIVGAVTVADLEPVSGPSPVRRVPELLRDRILAGASPMSERERALYLGLVIGDDRFQPLGQQLRFKASGLTHLLAVSGQNVAFALAAVRPFLQLFGYRVRFVGLVTTLAAFAVMTRLEPSVLRATVTAGIAAWAAVSGRERTGMTVLGVAVMVLVWLDPFLVRSVGFQLSVAASAGILILGPSLEARLPGPAWLRSPMAVTLSAQLGVSPLLTFYFGPQSLASVPANLLAGWAAAAIMTIGLSIGVVAGLLPDGVAQVLQAPARALLWWIEAVAEFFARSGGPRLGVPSLVLICGSVLVRKAARSVGLRLVPLAVIAAVVVSSIPHPPTTAAICGPGVQWFPGGDRGASVLVLSGESRSRSVEDCLAAGITRVDLLITERGTAGAARLVTGAVEVMDVGTVAAPPRHRVIGGTRQLERREVVTGTGTVTVWPSSDGATLEVRFQPVG